MIYYWFILNICACLLLHETSSFPDSRKNTEKAIWVFKNITPKFDANILHQANIRFKILQERFPAILYQKISWRLNSKCNIIHQKTSWARSFFLICICLLWKCFWNRILMFPSKRKYSNVLNRVSSFNLWYYFL